MLVHSFSVILFIYFRLYLIREIIQFFFAGAYPEIEDNFDFEMKNIALNKEARASSM